jgi:ureidoglycolate hydrolase
MTRAVLCQPLTPVDYAPFGGIISTDVATDRTVVVNNGTARRTPEVVPTINRYREAPSEVPARTVLNASLASPREVESWEGDKGKRVMKIKMLERHRFSTQSFVPMGANIKYLVVVTGNKSGSDDTPDLDKLHGFVAGDKQGVCYAPGVWHAPMAVIDNVSR